MNKKTRTGLCLLLLILVTICGTLFGCGTAENCERQESKAMEFTEFLLENGANTEDGKFSGTDFLVPGYSKSQLSSAKRAAQKLDEVLAEFTTKLGAAPQYSFTVNGTYNRAETDNVKDILLEVHFTANGKTEVYKFVHVAVEEVNGELRIAEFKLTQDIIFSTSSKKLNKFLDIFVNRAGYKEVLKGLKNTAIIAIAGLAIGIVIGTLIATVRVIPKYKLTPRVLNSVCSVYVGFFRGAPMAVQLLLFYYVFFPLMGLKITSVGVSVLVFGLNSGAYISEIMRSGIQSVDPGQMEAGRAVGLSFPTTMIKIVIPQAIKNILPTLGNEFIALIKETSVVSFVGATNLYTAFNMIGSNSYEFMVPFLAMAVVYIILIMLITLGIKIMERRLQKSDRRS